MRERRVSEYEAKQRDTLYCWEIIETGDDEDGEDDDDDDNDERREKKEEYKTTRGCKIRYRQGSSPTREELKG